MGTWPALRRELRETGISDAEFKGLRRSLTLLFPRLEPNTQVEVPSVTKAGHAYLLRIPTDAGARPTKIEVDLNPDLSSPAFEAYTDFRNRQPDPTEDSGGGERG
jgi:hypothetical protein